MLAEEGYIETEHRKSGGSNTDNTYEQLSDHFPHLSKALPRPKTHKDLKEQPRELHSIMRIPI